MKMAAALSNHFDLVYSVGTYAPFSTCGDTKRPDVIVRSGTTMIFVECDEHSHHDYNTTCEWAKLLNHMQSGLATEGITSVGFIRFNPDAWKVRGETVRTKWQTRMDVLVSHIQELLLGSNWSVSYLYYPTESENPIERIPSKVVQQWLTTLSAAKLNDITPPAA
ncbi:hypothetical protein SmJEL517_g05731 [Synchytrium microbalum]|uniref:Uncharacterized protein n=1 Tax=Synchytrium microbalum TaxID=1806994 RepID=A0A507BUZ1_9FUNG|nr:uncharacterized protein SmJEL517_g05731 [Synchytrium microbalum]TPX30789.1 hypothetical protein SmJEL517_g05731 [Synchytrium microbalum]